MQVIFVPSIGLDDSLIRRLASSVDYPIKWKCVLNNGPLGALESFSRDFPDWHVKETGLNYGVAGSWNACARWFSSEPAWLLMNEDAYFLPGQLETMCRISDHCTNNVPIVYVNQTRAFYCFIWHAIGREHVGDFDENFWPAYHEDLDYRVRIDKTQGLFVPQYATDVDRVPPVPHGKLRSGGTNYAAMLQGCGLLNRAYWLKKWGSTNFDNVSYGTPHNLETTPLFATPYNDHRLTAKDWVWYPEERAKRYPLWETFMSLPNRSIYE